ncbi:MAG: lysoplasmalogenase [Chloroflexia bacterium]|nr:lysoplasmalogenase [Chloroflexia bacterium]
MLTFPTLGHWILLLSLLLAAIDCWVLARGRRDWDRVLKPAVMVVVLLGAYWLTCGPHDPWQARWFLPGLALSLLGDVLLLFDGSRFFLAGLGAFLLAHLCYIVGLNPELPPAPAWLCLLPLLVLAGLIYRRLAVGLARRGGLFLRVSVVLYMLVLVLMTASTWATFWRPEWSALRRLLAVLGGSLFLASDTMLAWNRFVAPAPWLRLGVRVTYYAAQVALAASLWVGWA